MAEVGNVMENLIGGFQVPDVEGLRRGDYNEVVKMWQDREILLNISALDLEGTESGIHEEAVCTMNQIRKLALESTPCIRGLLNDMMKGSVSEDHDKMVECCFNYFQKYREIIGEACEQFSPDLWEIYELKFKQ